MSIASAPGPPPKGKDRQTSTKIAQLLYRLRFVYKNKPQKDSYL